MKKSTFARVMGVLLAVFVLALMPREVSSAAAAPQPVKNFRLICYANRGVFLGWDDVKKADKYNVYTYDAATGIYSYLGQSKTSAYRVKNLKVGATYQFMVRSVRKGKESANSSIVTATAKRIDTSNIHGRYWSAKMKKTTKVTLKNGTKMTIKKGTKLFAEACSKNRITVILKTGEKFRLKGTKLKYTNLWLTSSYKYYSQEQAEMFVNSKGYSSKTKWLIWISQYSGSVHIFKGSKGKWKRQRVAMCVVGKLGHTTPGVFKTIKRSSRNGKPQIYFSWNPEKNWGLSIHCRIDKHKRGAYSDGCIRLSDKDLKYVASKCPLGTTVVSY